MIDCLEKQQQQLQNHQLQLMNVNMSQQQHQQPPQHFNHQQPLNQNPPPYQLPGSANNPVNLVPIIYNQQQQQQQQQPQPQVQNSRQSQQRSLVVDTSNHQPPANELIGYYFGSISRETAEWILKTHANNMNGAYLLRSSGPNDDFVLSLMVNHLQNSTPGDNLIPMMANNLEVLHYKIVETEDSFVALHGQVGDEKFATIDELIDKAQGVATKPRWPIRRQALEFQILPPTYWGLTVDQIRLAILIKAKQWGFPLLSALFQQQDQVQQLTTSNPTFNSQQQNPAPCDDLQQAAELNATTLNNETIRTLIYKSLHEFQPWFHGKITREEAERRIEESAPRDGRFLVRERDNYSYAMCISHKKTTKHYRIDVLPTGELAIQDGRKFTSLMALVSHYTIMSDGLWCALTEACPRPINDGRGGCCDKTILSGPVTSNNGTFSSNSQIRIHQPTYNCYNNNSNSAVNQQNLYCVPPINSNGNNVNSNNSMHNLILPGPFSNIPTENLNSNSQPAKSHNYHQNNTNQTDEPTSVNSSSKGQSSMICSHQGGVVSIRAPIREWLQTINHKWSQLMAGSRNHNQTLNSFLFGNQNPLNNHCKYNHHGHPMNHRHRKCKNGHASCACIRQQMLANRAALAQNPTQETARGNGQQFAKLNEIDTAQGGFNGYQEKVPGKIHNCCSTGTSLCPTIKSQPLNGKEPNNLRNQNSSTVAGSQPSSNLNLTTNTLLSRLPLNSGFTLSSQSFIGSPLFAVRQTGQSGKNKLLAGIESQGSSSSNSGNSNTVEEEKLISPVQSISGNLNNPYSFDIYGSQTSTALVNDQLPTTSSSSSSETNRLMPQGLNSGNNLLASQQLQGVCAPTGKVLNQSDGFTAAPVRQNNSLPVHGGHILCGQHAGPAFRYTNFNDENDYKPCLHRPHPTMYRAADDSHLTTTSTQLACPAAMSKFVQFQDGQCLRTHRDTRSIQMAYLSARPHNNAPHPQQNHQLHHQPRFTNQVPLRELNAYLQQTTARNNASGANGTNCSYNANLNKDFHPADSSRSSKSLNYSAKMVNQSGGQENNGKTLCDEIDLMDFDFKYDRKLIKSSSIETLCGFNNDEEENLDDLINCKSNTELLLSLQSCLAIGKQQQPDILKPTPSAAYDTSIDPHELYNSEELNQDIDTSGDSALSSLIVDPKQNEQLDHMKKKHDLDELTTNIFEELSATMKAKVELENKRFGLNNNNNLHNMERPNIQASSQQDPFKLQQSKQQQQNEQNTRGGSVVAESNPLELLNEFDTLISSNNR